jgi:acetyl esterase
MLVIDGKLKGKDMIESGIAKYVEKAKQAAENLPTPMNPEEHRAVREALIEASPITPPSGMSIRNTFVNAPGRQIGIRVYLPEESKGMPPVLLFHGGGFVSGSIFTHDIYAISIAEFTGLPVISVNYRLAPENAYPSALDDCHFVLKWVIDHGSIFDFDASRIIIGGDSAGGNLAAGSNFFFTNNLPVTNQPN